MGSLHIDAARRLADELDSDPKTAAIIPECIHGIRTGRWNRDYLDAVGQLALGGPSKWPRHEVAAFSRLHSHLMTGAVSEVEIEVGVAPFPDAKRDANASVLQHLPPPFSAYVDRVQCNDDQDGWLEWNQPISLTRPVGVAYYASGTGHPKPVSMRSIIPAGEVPLEIGTTLPSRTLLHLGWDRGVARWPYESTCIRLFVSSKFPLPMFQPCNFLDE
jgi:hypothetical protein